MIVILKDYGKTCLCVIKGVNGSEHFIGTRHFAQTVANYMSRQLVDVSAEVEEQKLLEHNKVLIVKS